AEDAANIHLAFELRLDRAELNAAVLRDRRDAGGETAPKPGENQHDRRRAIVLGREDLRMIRFESKLGPMLMLLTEAVETFHVRSAMRAVQPFARGTPRELGRLGGLLQRFPCLEEGLNIDAVVDADGRSSH